MTKWIWTVILTALVPLSFMFVAGNTDVMGWEWEVRALLVFFVIWMTCFYYFVLGDK